MAKKKNLLKNIKLTSVDLCGRGCNPDAHIMLLKSAQEGGEEEMDKTKLSEQILKAVKEALGLAAEPDMTPEEEMKEIAKSWQESSESIWNDISMTAEEKLEKLEKSREEMNAYIASRTSLWAGVEEPVTKERKEEEESVTEITKEVNYDMLSDEDKATIDKIIAKYEKPEKAKEEAAKEAEKIKEQDPTEPVDGKKEGEEINPEVKKALDEMAELKESIEKSKLVEIAKKYEPLGKNADELAGTLYAIKKSDRKSYDEIIKVYDEALAMQEASGIFKEIGSSRTGGAKTVESAVAELRKSHPDMAETELVELAYRTIPDLPEY